MNFTSHLSARTARTIAAAGLFLAIIFGLIAANPSSTYAATPIAPGGAALIANTGGDAVRVHSGAGTTYDQVAVAHEGETVAILDGPAKDSGGSNWYKVSAPGGTGWVISDYLQGTPVSIVKGGKASIANTGGDTVRVRSGAGTTYDQIAEAHEGETVSILDGPAKDSGGSNWYKVSAPGGTGWVISDYLQGKISVPANANNNSTGKGTSTSGNSGIFRGGKATVSNTGGDPVRVRSGAGTTYDQIAEAHEGETVSILDGPAKDSGGSNWYKVSAPGGTGWMISDYLTAASAGSSSSNAKLAAPAGPKLTGFARVGNSDGDPVRLRTAASTSGDVITEFASDTSVAIKQGPVTSSDGIAWYQVSGQGLTGWMMAQYLVQSTAPASPPPAETPAANPAVETKAAPAPTAVPAAPAPAAPAAPQAPPAQSSAPTAAPAATPAPPRGSSQPQAQAASAPSGASNTGSAVVSLALKYVGSRYVMGGVGPRSFDCSGFVYYILNHSGVSISRDMYAQWNSGPHVSSKNLQPGDLIFFSNTYRRGLSHVAIYIGNGRIVHAENESTGVTISDLWSSYYSSHYTGAVRPSNYGR